VKVQGVSKQVKMLHAMRQLRGAYMENVRAGRCAMDEKILAEFDQELTYLHDYVHAKHTGARDRV
jgi:hypothetical protein